jgi:hypothetical protein
MSTKTRLILTSELKFESVDTITHGQRRPNDTAKAADGTVSHPTSPLSITLKQPRQVQTISVQKDADGNLHITLQD